MQMGGFKEKELILGAIAFFLFGITGLSYGIDKEEFGHEYELTYQELLKEDPEAATAFKEEIYKAVKNGEVEFDKEINDLSKEIIGDAKDYYEGKYGDENRGVLPGFDLKNPEQQTEALKRLDNESSDLLKAGLSEDDIKTIKEAILSGDKEAADRIFEKLAPEGFKDAGDYDHLRGDYGKSEHGGPPEGMDKEGFKEFTKEEMEDHFKEAMGREPSEFERDMMEREFVAREHEFERPEFEKYEQERPEYERIYTEQYEKYIPEGGNPPPGPY